jgi:integrase
MACIRKRRGRWTVDYRSPDGKRHWETYATRKEAEQNLARHVTAIRDGKYTPANDKRTVKDAFDSWWRLSVEGTDNRGGTSLRPTTRALYSMTWSTHVESKWSTRKLLSVGAEEVARWQQELLAAGHGAKTVLNAVQLLGSLFKHARRFRWIPGNPCEDVRKPRYKAKVRAFTAIEVAGIAQHADEATALLIRTAASTGLRFGELAGLEWTRVDLTAGAISVSRQFTHGAWSELKTANSRRRIPLARELVQQLRLHRLRTPGELVFPGTAGEPIDYHNFRNRTWTSLLKKAGVTGTFHMLRHFFVTALIQSGVNAKVAQTLAGHHSTSFTLDQYADAVPQQLEDAGEKVATVLLEASGSISVAAPKQVESKSAQVIEISGAPGEIRTPDPLVRSQVLYPTELRARCAVLLRGLGQRIHHRRSP